MNGYRTALVFGKGLGAVVRVKEGVNARRERLGGRGEAKRKSLETPVTIFACTSDEPDCVLIRKSR